MARVIPRPRGHYNDLAVPLTLYAYLACGRPPLVTDCVKRARVVTDADAARSVRARPIAVIRATPA